ncbi:MAG: hypothetical protein ACPGTS_00235, partial [Minisyncoccia bacterium]
MKNFNKIALVIIILLIAVIAFQYYNIKNTENKNLLQQLDQRNDQLNQKIDDLEKKLENNQSSEKYDAKVSEEPEKKIITEEKETKSLIKGEKITGSVASLSVPFDCYPGEKTPTIIILDNSKQLIISECNNNSTKGSVPKSHNINRGDFITAYVKNIGNNTYSVFGSTNYYVNTKKPSIDEMICCMAWPSGYPDTDEIPNIAEYKLVAPGTCKPTCKM